MTERPLTIAVAQARFAVADFQANIQKIVAIAKAARSQSVDLL
ncbi:hypothetical protein [Oligella sp. HMSC09E12]|nr:hypothetical protein [Oligella sp. HMSC09E12]